MKELCSSRRGDELGQSCKPIVIVCTYTTKDAKNNAKSPPCLSLASKYDGKGVNKNKMILLRWCYTGKNSRFLKVF